MREHDRDKLFDEKVTDIALDFFEVHKNFPKEIICEGRTLVKQESYAVLKMVLYKDKGANRVYDANSIVISWKDIAKVKPKLKLKK